MEAAEIFADATGVPIAEVRCIEPLKGGLTNASWLIEAPDGRWVLRVSLGRESALGIDRASEARILERAQAAGLFPEIRVCDPGRGLLVSRYLPGKVWETADAREPRNVERLGALLATIHALEPPSGIAKVDPAAILAHYRDLLERADRPFDDRLDARHRNMVAIASEFQQDAACLCHNDLHHLNLIEEERLWLLDWEYAGLGSTYFDLAAVACYHDYDRQQMRVLLAACMGDASSAACERLSRACEVFEHLRALWHALQAREGEMTRG